MSTIAVGVLQTHADPVSVVPERIKTYASPAVLPDAKSAGRVQLPACATHKPFCTGFVWPVKRTRLPSTRVTPSIVCRPLGGEPTSVTLTTSAGVFIISPVDATEST